MADLERDKKILASSFTLEVDGVTMGSFMSVSGLGYTAEVITHWETKAGGGQLEVQKRPGRISYNDITLKRGLSQDNELVKWYQTVLDGEPSRRNGSIVMYKGDSAKGDEVDRWNFFEGWISAWSATDLDASTDGVVVEEITITHERLERKG